MSDPYPYPIPDGWAPARSTSRVKTNRWRPTRTVSARLDVIVDTPFALTFRVHPDLPESIREELSDHLTRLAPTVAQPSFWFADLWISALPNADRAIPGRWAEMLNTTPTLRFPSRDPISVDRLGRPGWLSRLRILHPDGDTQWLLREWPEHDLPHGVVSPSPPPPPVSTR